MKTKIIIYALFVSLSVFAQSDFEQLQLQYEQAEAQYQEIYTKNSTEIENLKVKQNQLLDELGQKEEEIETAKSIKAKKLNKQIENLAAEVAQIGYRIKKYENEIEKAQARRDSLQLEIHKQQESIREEISTVNVNENESIGLSEEPELEGDEEDELYALDYSEEVTEGDEKSSQSTDDDPIGTILFAIGVIILFIIIARLKTKRCPYCGKKGTLTPLGDTRKYQYDTKGNVTRTGVLKRYKCSHCGRHVVKLEWG